MPEKWTEVIVCCSDGDYDIAHLGRNAWFSKMGLVNDVTHWANIQSPKNNEQ